ncbi:MAG: hypothetical protein LUQ11_09940 [Methylococcaceae bacterium]|nr:hypothetical protein [Methylococcaceae bacterium]
MVKIIVKNDGTIALMPFSAKAIKNNNACRKDMNNLGEEGRRLGKHKASLTRRFQPI